MRGNGKVEEMIKEVDGVLIRRDGAPITVKRNNILRDKDKRTNIRKKGRDEECQ